MTFPPEADSLGYTRSVESDGSLPADVQRMLRDYAGKLRSILGPDLAGIYVYGSLTLGDYRADRSDVDLIVIHRNWLTGAQLKEITALHEALVPSVPPASRGLEVSYVPLELVGTYGEPFAATLRRWSASGGRKRPKPRALAQRADAWHHHRGAPA